MRRGEVLVAVKTAPNDGLWEGSDGLWTQLRQAPLFLACRGPAPTVFHAVLRARHACWKIA